MSIEIEVTHLKQTILALVHHPLLKSYQSRELNTRRQARFAKRNPSQSTLFTPNYHDYQLNLTHYEQMKGWITKETIKAFRRYPMVKSFEYMPSIEMLVQNTVSKLLKISVTSEKKLKNYFEILDHPNSNQHTIQKTHDKLLKWLKRRGECELEVNYTMYQLLSKHTQKPINELQDLWKHARSNAFTSPHAYVIGMIKNQVNDLVTDIIRERQTLDVLTHEQKAMDIEKEWFPNHIAKDHADWLQMTKQYILPTQSISWLETNPTILDDLLKDLQKKKAIFTIYKEWINYVKSTKKIVLWKAYEMGDYIHPSQLKLVDFRNYYLQNHSTALLTINRYLQRFRTLWQQALTLIIENFDTHTSELQQIHQQVIQSNMIQSLLLNQLEDKKEFYTLCYFTQVSETWCEVHHSDQECFQNFTFIDDEVLKVYLFCHHLIDISQV